jgi:hypothetical protein
MSESGVSRRRFVCKTDAITGGWKTFINEDFNDLNTSADIRMISSRMYGLASYEMYETFKKISIETFYGY